jgi:hypothetical protein
MIRPVLMIPVEDASAMLRSAFCMVIVMALVGCGSIGSTSGSAHGDSELQAEPTCYRDTKSEYEAVGANQSPNAALLNIGAALTSNDNAFENCASSGRAKNKVN